jgi:hypothetical protein
MYVSTLDYISLNVELDWIGRYVKCSVPPPTCWNEPFASPSCLTPTVQHAPGGLDAMMEYKVV